MKIRIRRETLDELADGKRKIGVGTLMQKVTAALGIKACGGCKARKKALNRFKVKW